VTPLDDFRARVREFLAAHATSDLLVGTQSK